MTPKTTLMQCLKGGLAAGLTAAFINSLLFLIYRQTGLITDTILLPPDNVPMTVVPVILSSFVPAILASLVYYLFARFTKNGYQYFTTIAIILLIISFANPFFGIPNITIPYAVALNSMHVVVVAFLLFYLKKLTVSSYKHA